MSEHDHDDHDRDEHQHRHQHALSWEDALLGMREAAAHYYEHQFDWRGHGPPPDFDGPRFFPPAPEWRVEAMLDASVPGTGDHTEVATSTGKMRPMHVAGDLVFEGDGAEQRLRAFVSDRDGQPVLFVPFRDATSGVETYGAGRYVDAPFDEQDPDAPVELDFNYAYNPSCAYSPVYDCPFPPPQNRLAIAVRAGEMLPSGTHED